jgi:hypothetical protein
MSVSLDNNVYRCVFEYEHYLYTVARLRIFRVYSITVVEFRKSRMSLQSIDPFDSRCSFLR